MTTQEFRKELNGMGLSEDSVQAISEILDKAEASNSITQEHKDEIKVILNAEVAAAEIEAQALEETADALEVYVKEIDAAMEDTEEEITKLEEEFTKAVEEATQ